MMVAVFGSALLALGLGSAGQRAWALACIALCFALSMHLFLYEVYSPDYGFRMPWIRL